jgi:L-ascorbate metabolism protein UlaG (beta-lactamase superfamily)
VHRIFHSGDTGWFDALSAIGEEHGPFDVTMIQAGAYADAWPDVHLTPEEAVRAHVALGGELLLPIHWATFDLAPHPWAEPAERVLAEAGRTGVKVALPRPGAFVEPGRLVTPDEDPWWRPLTGIAPDPGPDRGVPGGEVPGGGAPGGGTEPESVPVAP